MSTPQDMLFRRIVVEQRLLSPADAERARHRQNDENPAPPLPVIMAELGFLTAAQVADVLGTHRDTLAQADPTVDRRIADWRLAAEWIARDPGTAGRVHLALRQAVRDGSTLARVLGVARPSDRADDTILEAGASPPTLLDAVSSSAAITRPSRGGAAPTGRRFGRYEIAEVLGRGGMGVVYKAWHPGLKTWCALKVLLAGEDASAEAITRFRREAQALARLRHPGIVAVHDLGDEEGKFWLAMEYVPGDTLTRRLEMAGRLDPREALRIVAEMAEALAAAHAGGVLHRDLKPGNVILPAEGGARLMDFGLAKMEGPDPTVATRTGELMGTPAYMSPEHVEHGMTEVDAQSDVYQVGAMLYEMLTGRRPYEGSTGTEVMLRVAQDEPPPPRHWLPTLDRDAEAVCRKAMARYKSQRYASAAELAQDCRRWLAGERVLARPEAAWRRWLRWARRRRIVAALAVVAAVAFAAAGTAGYQAWSAARERERAEAATRAAEAERVRLEGEVLAAVRRIAETNLQAALLVRRAGGKLGDTERSFLPPLREAVEQAAARAPKLAEPHFHLGRFLRALLRFDDALAEQEKALAQEPGYAPARYERGLLLLRRYHARLRERERAWWRGRGEELTRLGGGEVQAGAILRPPARAELEDDALRGILHHAAEDLAASDRPCGPGLLALAEGKPRVASGLLTKALEAEPEAEEAYEALAEIAREEEGPAGAIAWFGRGLERDRGYVPFLLGRAAAREAAGSLALASGGDPAAEFGAGADDLSRALDLDPERAEAWQARGRLRTRWAGALEGRGQRPDDLFEAAVTDLTAAIQKAPERAEAWMDRGGARVGLGCALHLRGEDGLPGLEAAVEDYGKAIALDREADLPWTFRGGAWSNVAYVRASRGQDPTEAYEAALADYGEALARNPARAETWLQRALARLNWGIHDAGRGRDPGEKYAAAIEDFGQTLALTPDRDDAWMRRGLARVNWANARAGRGEDPAELYAAGIADMGEALARNPGRDESWIKRGIARANWGVVKIRRGEDPSDLYELALADYAKALEINAARDEAWLKRGLLRVNWAGWRLTRGMDAEELLAAAIADLGEALARNPTRDEIRLRRAAAHVNRGYMLQTTGRDPAASYAAAIEDFGAALARNPARDETWMGRGTVGLNWGLYRSANGQDPGEQFAAAIADFSAALERNPARDESWLQRGSTRLAWAEWRAAHGEDPAALLAESVADTEEGRKRNPRRPDARKQSAQARASLALLVARAGRFDEAIAEAERALALEEGVAGAWAARGLARLRTGRTAEAEADFAEYERRAPADDAFRPQVAKWRAEAQGAK